MFVLRCSCRVCGTYMVQHEKGIRSGCICPECLSTCTLCTMSDGGKPLSPDELAAAYLMRSDQPSDAETDPLTGPISPFEYED